MARLLKDLGEIDDSVRAQLEEIVSRLDRETHSETEWEMLAVRREAVATAHEVVTANPDATQSLSPVLVRVLETELSRTYSSVVDKMLMQDRSNQIESLAARTLAVLAGPTLLCAYDTEPGALERLIAILGRTSIESASRSARSAGMKALESLCWSNPDEAVAILEANVTLQKLWAAISELVAAARSDSEMVSGTRLLLALVTRTRTDPRVHELCPQGVEAALNRDDERCRILGRYLAAHFGDRFVDARHVECGTEMDSLDTLAVEVGDRIDEAWSTEVATELQTLGGVSVLAESDVLNSLPRSLLEEVQRAGPVERRPAAQAVGLVLITRHSGKKHPQQQLARRVENGVGKYRSVSTRALGETIVATDDSPDWHPSGLIDTVDQRTGEQRRVTAQALGEYATVAILNAGSLCDRLVEQIDDGYFHDQTHAAKVLGVIVLTTDVKPDSVPRWLINRLEDHFEVKYADGLGELVAASYEAAERPLTESLVHRVNEHEYGSRRAALALGMVAVSTTECDWVDIPSAARQELQTVAQHRHRSYLAALGFGVAAAAQTKMTSPIRALTRKVERQRGVERQTAAQSIGTLASLGNRRENRVPAPLIRSHDNPVDREKYNRMVGEVVAVLERDGSDHLVHSLVSEITHRQGRIMRRRATRALGEILLTGKYPEYRPVAQSVVESVANYDRDEREWAARALGELTVANAKLEDEQPPRALVGEVRDSHGSTQNEAFRAVGEVVAFLDDQSYHDAPQPLVESTRSSMSAARILGRWVVDGPESAVSAVIAEIHDDTLYEPGLGDVLQMLASADALSAERFLRIVVDDSEIPADRITLESSLQAEDPVREAVLSGISEVISRADDPRFSALQRQLQQFVTGRQSVSDTTRLAAIDVLTRLDGSARELKS